MTATDERMSGMDEYGVYSNETRQLLRKGELKARSRAGGWREYYYDPPLNLAPGEMVLNLVDGKMTTGVYRPPMPMQSWMPPVVS